MIKHILPFLIGVLATSALVACDCVDTEIPFLDITHTVSFIALVKVNKHFGVRNFYNFETPLSMEAEVIEIYKGKENKKKITVWGSNGMNCRVYLQTFEEGSYYVIAFFPAVDKAGDYTVSTCGTYFLPVDTEKSMANGRIDSAHSSIKLKQLSDNVKKQAESTVLNKVKLAPLLVYCKAFFKGEKIAWRYI